MTGKLRQAYRESGAKGLLARGARSLLLGAGRRLVRTGEAIPLPTIAAGAVLPPEDLERLARNRAFAGRHAGRRCFIMATGPSLATQDLAPLAGEITFVLNAFWKHPVVAQWQPTYYFLADPLFFDGSEMMDQFFRELRARIHASTFFVPLFYFAPVPSVLLIREKGLLPAEQAYYFALNGQLDMARIQDVDLTGFVPAITSVVELCIMAAIAMGCSPIYLMGMDHDWLAHQGSSRYFYQGHAGLEKHPQIRHDLKEWSYRELMEWQLKLWRGYETLADLATRKGIKIYNATNGGFLDVFERTTYEEVVAEKLAAGKATELVLNP
jgi:hypothetical protein